MVTLTGVTSVAQAASRPDDLSDNAHRQLIGYIGLVLPGLLILIAVVRDGMERWRSLESISAYYYTGAVAAFVGMLVGLALFLFTYRGYKNKYNRADRWAAKAAAGAALVIAFFPTKAPVGVPALSWWTPATGVLHHVAAIVLFTIFAVFALWLFRLTADGEQPAADKRWRNNIYLACGIVIVGCIGWAGFSGLNGRPIFLPESIALIAFAVSWLVKGYAHRTIAGAVRSLLRP
jgi:succinate dehydrogenase/fumarate reductase cytochrome b subunit